METKVEQFTKIGAILTDCGQEVLIALIILEGCRESWTAVRSLKKSQKSDFDKKRS